MNVEKDEFLIDGGKSAMMTMALLIHETPVVVLAANFRCIYYMYFVFS